MYILTGTQSNENYFLLMRYKQKPPRQDIAFFPLLPPTFLKNGNNKTNRSISTLSQILFTLRSIMKPWGHTQPQNWRKCYWYPEHLVQNAVESTWTLKLDQAEFVSELFSVSCEALDKLCPCLCNPVASSGQWGSCLLEVFCHSAKVMQGIRKC